MAEGQGPRRIVVADKPTPTPLDVAIEAAERHDAHIRTWHDEDAYPRMIVKTATEVRTELVVNAAAWLVYAGCALLAGGIAALLVTGGGMMAAAYLVVTVVLTLLSASLVNVTQPEA